MKNKLIATLLGVVLVWFSVSAVKAADTNTEAAQLQLQQAISPSLHTALVNLTGLPADSMDLTIQTHQISVHVNNSQLNDTSPQVREVAAFKIASTIEKAISSKVEFSQVAVIHINFVRKTGNGSKLVQGTDFYKSDAGFFVIHKT
jgi:hypothetical protein